MSFTRDGIDLNRIRIFKLVVELGSFSKAAIRMSVPKSNVSRHISALEAEAGTQLLYRTTRTLHLTEAGKMLYAGSREALLKLEDTLSKVASDKSEVKGLIRFSAPTDLGVLAMPCVADFVKSYPQAQVEVQLTNEVLDLVKEGLDVVLRAGFQEDTSLISRKVANIRIGLVASPTFMHRFSKLISVTNLSQVPFISFVGFGKPTELKLNSKGKTLVVGIQPTCIVDSITAAKELVTSGAGIAALPLVICQSELQTGRLLHILPEWGMTESPVQVLIPTQKEKSRRVKVFVDSLVGSLREILLTA